MEVFACTHIGVFFMVCHKDAAFMDCIHIFCIKPRLQMHNFNIRELPGDVFGRQAAVALSGRLFRA